MGNRGGSEIFAGADCETIDSLVASLGATEAVERNVKHETAPLLIGRFTGGADLIRATLVRISSEDLLKNTERKNPQFRELYACIQKIIGSKDLEKILTEMVKFMAKTQIKLGQDISFANNFFSVLLDIFLHEINNTPVNINIPPHTPFMFWVKEKAAFLCSSSFSGSLKEPHRATILKDREELPLLLFIQRLRF